MKRLLPLSLSLLLAACASRPALPPPPTAPSSPTSLVGASAVDLLNTLGKPNFVHKENGAEMWRYDGAGCRAFFFLYQNGAVQVVRHIETIPQGAGVPADPNCLAILRGRPPVS